jgi:predicted nucleic acid-binding protein
MFMRSFAARHAGEPMPLEDSYIAAIARRHNLTVVTGNVKDFQRPGVRVFDPFTEVDKTMDSRSRRRPDPD